MIFILKAESIARLSYVADKLFSAMLIEPLSFLLNKSDRSLDPFWDSLHVLSA